MKNTKTKTNTKTNTKNTKTLTTQKISKIAIAKTIPKDTNPLINFIINLLKSFAKIFNKFTPIIWILEILRFTKGTINSFFTSFRIIRESFEYLNRLPVFQLFRKGIRFLSVISLIFNLIILTIFTQFSPLSWIYSFPAISQIGAFVYDSAPEKAQGFMLYLSLKIKTFLLWIWHYLIDFIKLLIKSVLGEIENYPTDPVNSVPIDVDKDKYGDINNKEYLKWFLNKLDEYKYPIIIASIVTVGGIFIYLYWDSISCSWRRHDNPDEPFAPLPTESDIHEPGSPILPSPDSSSSGNSFDKYFRPSIADKLARFKTKVGEFIQGRSISSKAAGKAQEFIPSGIYQMNGQDHYNGLPLPRVETLDNGVEYYFAKGEHGFVRVLNNTFNSLNMDIISPVTGKAITTTPVSIGERIAFINRARNNANFNAPENSFARNPVIEEIFNIGQPSVGSTSASTSNLPNLNLDDFKDIPGDVVPLTDIDLTPKPKPAPLPTELDFYTPFE
jgi:hypothetical protein